MVDVTRSDFEEKFPEIVSNIRKADFVALDTEFTGLKIAGSSKSSLFDSGESRYVKLRPTVSQIIPSQIGLSTFRRDKSGQNNEYITHTYNIYLYPESFGPIDIRFICQASSLRFLCDHKFDFNKFVYEGVSFLNDVQERELKQHLSQHVLTSVDRNVNEIELQIVCSDVAKWSVSAKEGEHILVEIPTELNEFILSTELKQRFRDLWPTSKDGKLLVEKVSHEKRQKYEKEDLSLQAHQQQGVLNRILGFTRVFRELVKAKKPIIGHNMFMDLLLMYDKFYQPLPARYKDFKSDIVELFPVIYDTKHITATLRRQFEESGVFASTSLGAIYLAFLSEKGSRIAMFMPRCKMADGFDRYKNQDRPHEAGYDSFMAGVVFIKTSHIYYLREDRPVYSKSLDIRLYLSEMEEYTNCINIIRASVNHIKLNSSDPKSTRPELLYIRYKQKGKLNTTELASLLSNYGIVDVRPRGDRHALVATGNYRCAKDILRSLKGNEKFQVAKYNMWKHSPLVRGLMWGGVVISGGLCLWALLSSGPTDTGNGS